MKVAVIGGGPAAMFFCHSYNKLRTQHHEEIVSRPINKKSFTELEITCFEKMGSLGGIWRPSSSEIRNNGIMSGASQKDDDNRIYDELWTNGASHTIEFYDYTFDEHFGKGVQVPLYFPRRDVQEYIFNRVSKDCPKFFDEFFQLNTQVVHVCYCQVSKLFTLTLQDALTQETSQGVFDRCIWAAGENGVKNIPKSLRKMFSTTTGTSASPPAVAADHGGTSVDTFTARQSSSPLLLHSTETHKIRQHVSDSTVLLIGGSYSAEDLALQCWKWGAAKVHVISRRDENAVSWTSAWPSGKIQVHDNVSIKSVSSCGTIYLEHVRWKWPEEYVPCQSDMYPIESVDYDSVQDEKKTENDTPMQTSFDKTLILTGVDIVIFCTGYKANLSMLDEPLIPTKETVPLWNMGDMPFQSKLLNEKWRMTEDPELNPAHIFTGHVPPGQGRMIYMNYNHPDIYRGFLVPNPHMMFICEYGSEAPLLSLDVHGWLLCSYLTGRLPMPTMEQMQAAIEKQVVDQFQLPYLRFFMDEGYSDAFEQHSDFWSPESFEHVENCFWWKCKSQFEKYNIRLLAKVMNECQYPGASLGTYQHLNENGQALYDFNLRSYSTRRNVICSAKEDLEWKTFRDDTNEPSGCYSLYTKTTARPLRKRWLDAKGDVSIRAGDV